VAPHGYEDDSSFLQSSEGLVNEAASLLGEVQHLVEDDNVERTQARWNLIVAMKGGPDVRCVAFRGPLDGDLSFSFAGGHTAEGDRFPASSLLELPFVVPSASRGSQALWGLYKDGTLAAEYGDYQLLALFVQHTAVTGAEAETWAARERAFVESFIEWGVHVCCPFRLEMPKCASDTLTIYRKLSRCNY